MSYRHSIQARGGCTALCMGLAGVLAGCGGGGGSGGNEAPAQPPTAQASTLSMNVLGVTASSVTGKVAASDPQGLALSYTVATAPTAGTVTLDARTGDFTYAVSGHSSASQDRFTVSVSNGRAAAVNTAVTVRMAGDPLLVNQWHIRSTGASAYSTTLPVAGNDINVAGAWAAGYSGMGIKVAVVDSGLEVAHEDLAANVDLANSFNFLTNTTDPTRPASDVGTDHGTMVAGIIGATAFNGKGGRGVAYGARLRGYNYLANRSLANYGDAMGNKPFSADNAVFNLSLGVTAPLLFAPNDRVDVDNNLNSLRGGLGAVMVKSAGNFFRDIEATDSQQRCAGASSRGLSCAHTAQDPSHGAPTPLVVGAINAEGKRSSYSTAGSALWVSAPGGEYGYDSAHFTGANLSAAGLAPAIVTTTRSGCPNREGAPGVANALVTGNHPAALDCQYTAQMNGTSAAAPNVAGVVALMLEANPRLSSRDVKFILASTARRVDPGQARVTATDLAPGATVTLEQGWVKNAADRWYSNWYGFGAVDAAKAVEMARSYTSYLSASKSSPPLLTTTRPEGYDVPPRSASGLGVNFSVNQPFTTVERVIVTAYFSETPSVECNQIEVTSPAGTKSILLHAENGYTQTTLPGTKFLSNAFYGEPVNGTWRLSWFNFCTGRTLLSPSPKEAQSIQFFGR